MQVIEKAVLIATGDDLSDIYNPHGIKPTINQIQYQEIVRIGNIWYAKTWDDDAKCFRLDDVDKVLMLGDVLPKESEGE